MAQLQIVNGLGLMEKKAHNKRKNNIFLFTIQCDVQQYLSNDSAEWHQQIFLQTDTIVIINTKYNI